MSENKSYNEKYDTDDLINERIRSQFQCPSKSSLHLKTEVRDYEIDLNFFNSRSKCEAN